MPDQSQCPSSEVTTAGKLPGRFILSIPVLAVSLIFLVDRGTLKKVRERADRGHDIVAASAATVPRYLTGSAHCCYET